MTKRSVESSVAVALSVLLLVPVATSAQAPVATSIGWADEVDDLRDLITGEPTVGAKYTDLTELDVSLEGNQLIVRFEVAAPVPEAPDPQDTTVSYALNIDADGDGVTDHRVDIRSDEGWHVEVFDDGSGLTTGLGDAVVADDSLVATVPLAGIGAWPDLRFQGQMQATDYPDPATDSLAVVEWEDRIPGSEDDWFGQPQPATPPAAAADPISLARLRALVTTDQPRGAFGDVRTRFADYLADSPDAAATLGIVADEVTRLLSLCQEELKKAKGSDACINAFLNLGLAYAQTGDDALYDLLGSFIGSTLPAYEGKSRKDYRTGLANLPDLLARSYPELVTD